MAGFLTQSPNFSRDLAVTMTCDNSITKNFLDQKLVVIKELVTSCLTQHITCQTQVNMIKYHLLTRGLVQPTTESAVTRDSRRDIKILQAPVITSNLQLLARNQEFLSFLCLVGERICAPKPALACPAAMLIILRRPTQTKLLRSSAWANKLEMVS